jgi:hypothetical protein
MTSPARILIDRRQELLRALRAARMAPDLREALLAWIPGALEATAARSEGATRANRARSERQRAGIRLALGALPAARPAASVEPRLLTALVRKRLELNPERYGLARVPCDVLIRSEINRQFSTGITPKPSNLAHPSTKITTRRERDHEREHDEQGTGSEHHGAGKSRPRARPEREAPALAPSHPNPSREG